MSRSRWLAPIAIVLALLVFANGCATSPPRGDGDGSSSAAAVSTDGAQQVHGHGDARAILFAVGAVLIVLTVIIDVIVLPCTAPYHRPFCCTEGVIFVCYR